MTRLDELKEYYRMVDSLLAHLQNQDLLGAGMYIGKLLHIFSQRIDIENKLIAKDTIVDS